MKKYFKIGKRILALFIIAMLNVSTFATNASNDDGDFVTKTEFDSITKMFNDQMEEFQSGLNAKIDYAIASYIGGLSGLTTSKANNLINNLQSSGKYTFVVWNDPGATKTGYRIYLTGNCTNQTDQTASGYQYQITVTNNTVSTTNNKIRHYQADYLGYPVYLGIAYPAIYTTWNMSGQFYSTSVADVQIGTTVSANARFTRTAPNTTTGTTTAQKYWESTSPGGWTPKYGYLSHSQDWIQASANTTKYYELAANTLSTTATAFLQEELRYTDNGMECTSSNRYSLNQNVTASLGINPSGTQNKMKWYESMPYWTVKTTDFKWSDLYNYNLVAAGYNLRLYQGLPLFEATIDGEATFVMQLWSSADDCQYIDFAIKDSGFSNGVAANGNVMSSVYPGYDSTDTVTTLVNVNKARVRAGDNITVKIPVVKNKTYYIKLTPYGNSTTTTLPAVGKYCRVEKIIGDINITAATN